MLTIPIYPYASIAAALLCLIVTFSVHILTSSWSSARAWSVFSPTIRGLFSDYAAPAGRLSTPICSPHTPSLQSTGFDSHPSLPPPPPSPPNPAILLLTVLVNFVPKIKDVGNVPFVDVGTPSWPPKPTMSSRSWIVDLTLCTGTEIALAGRISIVNVCS